MVYSGDFEPRRYSKEKARYTVYKIETRCYNCGGVQDVTKTEVGHTRATGPSQAVRNVCHRLGAKIADVQFADDATIWVRFCAEVLQDGDTGGHTPTGGETCQH